MLSRTRTFAVTMTAALVLTAVSGGGAAAAVQAAAEPVAVLVKTTGAVHVERPGAAKKLTGAVGLALLPGDRVVVPAGGKAVVMYRTGQMQTAAQTLRIAEPERKDAGSLYARTVNTMAQVAATDAAKQPNRQGMIRPVAGAPAAISPRNDLVVLDLRPQLVWFAAPAATGYTVQIRRTDVDGSPPVRFPVGSDTVWTYPSTAPPLAPGGTYEWLVGVNGGRIGAKQSFRTVSAEQFARVSATVDELQAAGVDPATDGAFVVALAYRDAGLMYEAGRALDRLARDGDGLGRAFRLLRGEVLNAMGDLEGAAREFMAADAASGS